MKCKSVLRKGLENFMDHIVNCRTGNFSSKRWGVVAKSTFQNNWNIYQKICIWYIFTVFLSNKPYRFGRVASLLCVVTIIFYYRLVDSARFRQNTQLWPQLFGVFPVESGKVVYLKLKTDLKLNITIHKFSILSPSWSINFTFYDSCHANKI